MPEELKSFLVSVSVILTVALFIPCLESIAKLMRRNSQQQAGAKISPIKSATALQRDAA